MKRALLSVPVASCLAQFQTARLDDVLFPTWSLSFAQCPSARTRPKINIGCCWGKSDSQGPQERDDASLKSFKFGKLRLPFRGAEIAFGTGRVRLATVGVSGLATIFKGNTVELVQVHPSKSARKTPAQSGNPRSSR